MVVPWLLHGLHTRARLGRIQQACGAENPAWRSHVRSGRRFADRDEWSPQRNDEQSIVAANHRSDGLPHGPMVIHTCFGVRCVSCCPGSVPVGVATLPACHGFSATIPVPRVGDTSTARHSAHCVSPPTGSPRADLNGLCAAVLVPEPRLTAQRAGQRDAAAAQRPSPLSLSLSDRRGSGMEPNIQWPQHAAMSFWLATH